MEIPIKTENANSKYVVNIYHFKVLTDVEAEWSTFCNFILFWFLRFHSVEVQKKDDSVNPPVSRQTSDTSKRGRRKWIPLFRKIAETKIPVSEYSNIKLCLDTTTRYLDLCKLRIKKKA